MKGTSSMPQQQSEIMNLARKARTGDAEAQVTVEKAVGLPKGSFAQMLASLEECKVEANKGNPKAIRLIGSSFANGLVVEQDLELAEFTLRMAFDLEPIAESHYYLATTLMMREKFDEAITLLEKVLEMGGEISGVPREKIISNLEMTKTLKSLNTTSSAYLPPKSEETYVNTAETSATINIDKNKTLAFRQHVAKMGSSIYYDKRTLTALVSDIFFNEEKLLNTLKIAINDGIAEKIAELHKQYATPQESLLNQITYSFARRYGIEENRCAEAVIMLTAGLGWV